MSWLKCVGEGGEKKNPPPFASAFKKFIKYISFYLFRALQGIKFYLSGHMQYLNA